MRPPATIRGMMSNARLQQLMTLSLMGWALAWAAAWGYHGRWAMAAWALALLVAVGRVTALSISQSIESGAIT